MAIHELSSPEFDRDPELGGLRSGQRDTEGQRPEEFGQTPATFDWRVLDNEACDLGNLLGEENPQNFFSESPFVESTQNPDNLLPLPLGDIRSARHSVWEAIGYVPLIVGGVDQGLLDDEIQQQWDELDKRSKEAWASILASRGYSTEERAEELQGEREKDADQKQSRREREEWEDLSLEEQQRQFKEAERIGEEFTERLWKAYKRFKRREGKKIDPLILEEYQRLKRRKST